MHGFPLNRVESDGENYELSSNIRDNLTNDEQLVKKQQREIKRISEYKALLSNKSPEQLPSRDYFIHSFLLILIDKLNISPNESTNKCNSEDFAHVLNWINHDSISSPVENLSMTVKHIVQKSGLIIDFSAKKKKPIIDKLLSHFLGMTTTELRRGTPTESGRLREFKFIKHEYK